MHTTMGSELDSSGRLLFAVACAEMLPVVVVAKYSGVVPQGLLCPNIAVFLPILPIDRALGTGLACYLCTLASQFCKVWCSLGRCCFSGLKSGWQATGERSLLGAVLMLRAPASATDAVSCTNAVSSCNCWSRLGAGCDVAAGGSLMGGGERCCTW